MTVTLARLWVAFLADDYYLIEKILGEVPPADLDQLQGFIATIDGAAMQEQMYRHR